MNMQLNGFSAVQGIPLRISWSKEGNNFAVSRKKRTHTKLEDR